MYSTEADLKHFITALKMVGVGECTIRTVKTMDLGGMDCDDLRRLIKDDKKVGKEKSCCSCCR